MRVAEVKFELDTIEYFKDPEKYDGVVDRDKKTVTIPFTMFEQIMSTLDNYKDMLLGLEVKV